MQSGGRAVVRRAQSRPGGPLVGHPLKDIRKHIPQVDARIAAIFRRDTPVTPEGDTQVEAGDEVLCTW